MRHRWWAGDSPSGPCWVVLLDEKRRWMKPAADDKEANGLASRQDRTGQDNRTGLAVGSSGGWNGGLEWKDDHGIGKAPVASRPLMFPPPCLAG